MVGKTIDAERETMNEATREIIVFTLFQSRVKEHLDARMAVKKFTMRILEPCVDNAAEFAKYKVTCFPTVVCHDGSKEIGRIIGTHSAASVNETLDGWGV